MLNRRQWLKTGALSAAGLALHPRIESASPLAQPGWEGAIRLHSNENPYGPSDAAREAIVQGLTDANLYPTFSYNKLKTLIAEREGLTPDHVVLGAGSHQILQMAGIAYGLDGGEVLTADPTYEGLGRYAESVGAYVHRVPVKEDDLSIDLEAMDRHLTQAVRLVFICNPNNPTGGVVAGSDLQAYCEAVAPRSVVLVDEAYYELADDPAYETMVPLVEAGHNVIVSRTFSKIYGMAGLRVGYGLARPDIAARLRRFGSGSGINILGIHGATAAIQDQDYVTFSREKNAEAKTVLTRFLDAKGIRHLPSNTNFVFFHLGHDVRDFARQMEARGILVGRPFPPYTDWCRISLGTPEQMQTFVEAFEAELTD